MTICPICNGLKKMHMPCPNCGCQMLDKGRLMDYYDDYSPYMDIDLMKMEDGFPDSYTHHKCPHLYSCPQCFHDQVVLLKE